MKHFLLLLAFFFTGFLATAQSSLSERLALESSDVADRSGINVYPNPATTYIGLTEGTSVERILVFNMVGRQIKTFEAGEGDRYFVGDLPRGLYLVQLVGRDNEIITTKRVRKL